MVLLVLFGSTRAKAVFSKVVEDQGSVHSHVRNAGHTARAIESTSPEGPRSTAARPSGASLAVVRSYIRRVCRRTRAGAGGSYGQKDFRLWLKCMHRTRATRSRGPSGFHTVASHETKFPKTILKAPPTASHVNHAYAAWPSSVHVQSLFIPANAVPRLDLATSNCAQSNAAEYPFESLFITIARWNPSIPGR